MTGKAGKCHIREMDIKYADSMGEYSCFAEDQQCDFSMQVVFWVGAGDGRCVVLLTSCGPPGSS